MSTPAISFAISLGLTNGQIRSLEKLTPEQIAAIRRNVRVRSAAAALKAAAQYMADGGNLADLIA